MYVVYVPNLSSNSMDSPVNSISIKIEKRDDSDNASSPFSKSSEYTSEGSLVCPSSEYICSDIAEAGDLDSYNSGVTVLDVNCVVERKGHFGRKIASSAITNGDDALPFPACPVGLRLVWRARHFIFFFIPEN